MLYQLHRRQTIPARLDEVWAFFSDPRNLNKITPPDMAFEILFGGEGRMAQGQLIAYRIRLFPLVKTRWLTEITRVREPDSFIDQQRLGPYRFWHHEHRFKAVEGGVEMIDLVTYQLPLGLISPLLHALYVGPRLERIFEYRARKVARIFSSQAAR